jgi:hypothetical protein
MSFALTSTSQALPYHVRTISGPQSSDLIINNTDFVLIKNTLVTFPPNKGIIIKKGGALRIENSTITINSDINGNSLSANDWWAGIILEGDPNISQAEMHSHYCLNKYVDCISFDGQNSEECFRPNQGALYMTGSKLKFAHRAILVGNYSPTDHSDYFPIDNSKSGGYLFANDNEFMNCNFGLGFAPYSNNNFFQMSIIEKNTFVARKNGGQSQVAQIQLRFIDNDFKHAFKNNKIFTHYTSSYSNLYQGLELISSNVEIEKNIFSGLRAQPLAARFFAPSIKLRTKMIDNEFNDIGLFGCDLDGVDQLEIKGNTITNYNTPFRNHFPSTLPIYIYQSGEYGYKFNGCNNLKFIQNGISSFQNTSKPSVYDGIIYETNQGQSILATNNSFKNTKRGLDYNDDHTRTIWDCNTFDISKSLDVHVHTGSTFSLLGSYTRPLSNEFTGNLSPNFESDVFINTPPYLFNPNKPIFEPTTINLLTFDGISISNPCPYEEEVQVYKKDYCGNIIYTTKDYKFLNYNLQKANYRSIPTTSDEYLKLKAEVLYDDCFSDIIDILQITDSAFLPESNIDSNQPNHGSILWPYTDTFHNDDIVADYSDSFSYTVNPNPFSDLINIGLTNISNISLTTEVIIYDINFNELYNLGHTVGANSINSFSINVTTWPVGDYFVHFVGSNFNFHKSIHLIK